MHYTFTEQHCHAKGRSCSTHSTHTQTTTSFFSLYLATKRPTKNAVNNHTKVVGESTENDPERSDVPPGLEGEISPGVGVTPPDGGDTLGLSPSEQIKMPFSSTVQPGGVRAAPLQFS